MRMDGEREVRELQPIRNSMFMCEYEGNLSKPECEEAEKQYEREVYHLSVTIASIIIVKASAENQGMLFKS